MGQEQFDEYMALNNIVPYGDEKICLTIANVGACLAGIGQLIARQLGAGRGEEVSPNDFLPWLVEECIEAREVSPNAMAAAFSSYVERNS